MAETNKVDFKLTREGLVKIEHKETKGQAKVLPESVPVWLNKGWTLVESDNNARSVTAAPKEK